MWLKPLCSITYFSIHKNIINFTLLIWFQISIVCLLIYPNIYYALYKKCMALFRSSISHFKILLQSNILQLIDLANWKLQIMINCQRVMSNITEQNYLRQLSFPHFNKVLSFRAYRNWMLHYWLKIKDVWSLERCCSIEIIFASRNAYAHLWTTQRIEAQTQVLKHTQEKTN